MGGQTGLNCALDLARNGVLAKYKVEMIAPRSEAIDKAEDREKFKQAMARIGLACPRRASRTRWMRHSGFSPRSASRCDPSVVLRWAARAAASPITVRSSSRSCERGLDASPTRELLIEESVIGWKRVEMEVVRDRKTTASSCARSRTSTRWGAHRRLDHGGAGAKRSPTRNTR